MFEHFLQFPLLLQVLCEIPPVLHTFLIDRICFIHTQGTYYHVLMESNKYQSFPCHENYFTKRRNVILVPIYLL